MQDCILLSLPKSDERLLHKCDFQIVKVSLNMIVKVSLNMIVILPLVGWCSYPPSPCQISLIILPLGGCCSSAYTRVQAELALSLWLMTQFVRHYKQRIYRATGVDEWGIYTAEGRSVRCILLKGSSCAEIIFLFFVLLTQLLTQAVAMLFCVSN